MSWGSSWSDGSARCYTVGASLEQAERWESAAQARGFLSVESWLAQTPTSTCASWPGRLAPEPIVSGYSPATTLTRTGCSPPLAGGA